MKAIPTTKEQKIVVLDSICKKFERRWHRPKEQKNLSGMEYLDLLHRAQTLRRSLEWKYDKKTFDEVPALMQYNYEAYTVYRNMKKAKGKEKFENNYRISPWFFQASFNSDYGEYTCDKCGRTFYHSPATIYLAKEMIANCACGWCANNLAQGRGQETIYG